MQFRVVFAWFYISSVVSPARRDIFVKSHGTDSYSLGPSSSSSSSSTTTTTITTTITIIIYIINIICIVYILDARAARRRKARGVLVARGA